MSLLLTIMTNLSSLAKHIGIETIEFWKLYQHVNACHSITPKELALRRSTNAILLIGPATSTKLLLSIEPVHFTQRNLDTKNGIGKSNASNCRVESNGLTGEKCQVMIQPFDTLQCQRIIAFPSASACFYTGAPLPPQWFDVQYCRPCTWPAWEVEKSTTGSDTSFLIQVK